MTRYEAHIRKDWREYGLAHLLVARIQSDGSADVGVFLVDVFCLGVKDAFLETDVPASEVENFIAENLPDDGGEHIHPTCAKKLIEGALAYAEALGFAPHRDFRKARRVLSGIDAALCPTEFTFGCEGRPCYVQGPNDSAERVERVLAILEARCGPDGFDYELADDEEDDDIQTVREALIAWLDAEPIEVPRFYQLSGMVTALHVCPGSVSPIDVIDGLWDRDEHIWADQDAAQGFMSLLQDYWNYVADLVREAAAPDAPMDAQILDIWSEDLPQEDGLVWTAVSLEWATGFLRATELWPEAWEDALMRADLAPHWEVVRWWVHITEEDNKDRIADAAEAPVPRTLNQSVIALTRALRGDRPWTDVT